MIPPLLLTLKVLLLFGAALLVYEYLQLSKPYRLIRASKRNSTLKDAPKILIWTQFFEADFTRYIVPAQCPFTCDYAVRGEIPEEEADVVIFHVRDIEGSILPRARRASQVYVAALIESPYHIGDALTGSWISGPAVPSDYFNTTLDYRLDDGGYFWGYGRMVKVEKEKRRPLTEDQKEVLFRNKTNLALAMVSNCETPSGREAIYEELSKFAGITFVGSCFPDARTRAICHRRTNCEEDLLASHKFLFAFENSICKDYITEKFWRLRHNIVPVVQRRSIVRGVPASAYIAVDDFNSTAELVDKLKWIASNKDEYLKFFDWREEYVDESTTGVCNMCRDLHIKNVSTHRHLNILAHYSREQCEAPANSPHRAVRLRVDFIAIFALSLIAIVMLLMFLHYRRSRMSKYDEDDELAFIEDCMIRDAFAQRIGSIDAAIRQGASFGRNRECPANALFAMKACHHVATLLAGLYDQVTHCNDKPTIVAHPKLLDMQARPGIRTFLDDAVVNLVQVVHSFIECMEHGYFNPDESKKRSLRNRTFRMREHIANSQAAGKRSVRAQTKKAPPPSLGDLLDAAMRKDEALNQDVPDTHDTTPLFQPVPNGVEIKQEAEDPDDPEFEVVTELDSSQPGPSRGNYEEQLDEKLRDFDILLALEGNDKRDEIVKCLEDGNTLRYKIDTRRELFTVMAEHLMKNCQTLNFPTNFETVEFCKHCFAPWPTVNTKVLIGEKGDLFLRIVRQVKANKARDPSILLQPAEKKEQKHLIGGVLYSSDEAMVNAISNFSPGSMQYAEMIEKSRAWRCAFMVRCSAPIVMERMPFILTDPDILIHDYEKMRSVKAGFTSNFRREWGPRIINLSKITLSKERFSQLDSWLVRHDFKANVDVRLVLTLVILLNEDGQRNMWMKRVDELLQFPPDSASPEEAALALFNGGVTFPVIFLHDSRWYVLVKRYALRASSNIIHALLLLLSSSFLMQLGCGKNISEFWSLMDLIVGVKATPYSHAVQRLLTALMQIGPPTGSPRVYRQKAVPAVDPGSLLQSTEPVRVRINVAANSLAPRVAASRKRPMREEEPEMEIDESRIKKEVKEEPE